MGFVSVLLCAASPPDDPTLTRQLCALCGPLQNLWESVATDKIRNNFIKVHMHRKERRKRTSEWNTQRTSSTLLCAVFSCSFSVRYVRMEHQLIMERFTSPAADKKQKKYGKRRIKKISHSPEKIPYLHYMLGHPECSTVEGKQWKTKNKKSWKKREQPEHRSSFQQQNIRKRFLSFDFYLRGFSVRSNCCALCVHGKRARRRMCRTGEWRRKYETMPHGNLAPSVSFMRLEKQKRASERLCMLEE